MPVLVPEAPVSPELPVPEIPGEGFPEGPDMPQPGAPEVEIPGAPTLHPEPLPQVEIPQVHEAVTAHGEPSEEPAAVLEEIPMVSIDGGEETSSNTAQSTQGGVLHTARRDRPVSTVGFFWTEFLLLIPLLNLVLLFVWAFREKTNRNRRAFARSVLIWILDRPALSARGAHCDDRHPPVTRHQLLDPAAQGFGQQHSAAVSAGSNAFMGIKRPRRKTSGGVVCGFFYFSQGSFWAVLTLFGRGLRQSQALLQLKQGGAHRNGEHNG